jgi:hypothetical protein
LPAAEGLGWGAKGLASPKCDRTEFLAGSRSNHLNRAADPALAVDGLSTFLGAHPRSETDLAGPLDLADFMRVMHGSFLVQSMFTWTFSKA